MSVTIAKPKPGFNAVTSKGIFVGTQVLEDRNGRCIGLFNIFAAPQDLNIDPSGRWMSLTFRATAKELARRESWLGYECCKFDYWHYEERLFKGLEDGSAVGKWFIPTREILCGKDVNGQKIRAESLFDLRNTGDFGSSFAKRGSGYALWYWSCTETGHADAYAVAFTDGRVMDLLMDSSRLSCRPCRVELAP
jgi:hypothetical protein